MDTLKVVLLMINTLKRNGVTVDDSRLQITDWAKSLLHNLIGWED